MTRETSSTDTQIQTVRSTLSFGMGKAKTIGVPGPTFSDTVGINNRGTIVVNWVRTSHRYHHYSSLYDGSKFKRIDVADAYETFVERLLRIVGAARKGKNIHNRTAELGR